MVLFLATMMILCVARASPSDHDYLTRRDLARIHRMMPVYEHAARKVGVPVLALPALHVRESDLRGVRGDADARLPVHNIGGPFMMDMGADGDPVQFDQHIRAEEARVAFLFDVGPPVPRVRDDLAFAVLCAAVELREKARGSFWRQRGIVDQEVLADAFWGYNGRRSTSERSWRRSPYVWNDPLRGRRMVISVPRSYGVAATAYVDARPGVMVIYRELERRTTTAP